jgi:hypothetical protein
VDRVHHAKIWKTSKKVKAEGGVVVFYDGEPCGWMNELRDADHWVPGCIAVDEAGNEWRTVGGDSQRGALRWEQIKTTDFTKIPLEFGL